MPFPSFESAHREAPFSRNAREIAEIYFPGAEIQQIGNFTVVAGTGGSHVLIQELKIFEESNGNDVYDPGELVLENYNLFIFISRDTAQLQEAFNNFKPEPNDVCLFLEDNSTDIFSGTTAWVRQSKSAVFVGSKVRNELSQWFSGTSDSALDQLNGIGERLGFATGLSRNQIAELIKEGEVRDAGMALFISIIQIFNGLNILAAPLYQEIAALLSQITTFLRENIEFKNSHWDPKAKVPKGKDQELVENTSFEPVLLPLSHRAVEELASLQDAGASIIIDRLRQELNRKRRSIRATLSRLNRVAPKAGLTLSQSMRDFIDRAGTLIDALLQRIAEDYSEKIVPLFVSYSKTWLNAVNAFHCGLWNALVEAVLGFVDLLIAGLQVFAFLGNSVKDAQKLVPPTLEVLDELIQAFLEVDFIAIIEQLIGKSMAMLSKINLSSFTAGLSAERMAYFLGFLVGFIVQTIVELLYSGGTKKVLDMVDWLGRMGSSVYDFVKNGVTTAVRASAGAWEKLIDFIRHLVKILKAGGDEVVRMFESVLEIVIQGGMLADEVAEQIFRRLGIPPADQKAMRDLGIRLVSDTNGVARACNIMRADLAWSQKS